MGGRSNNRRDADSATPDEAEQTSTAPEASESAAEPSSAVSASTNGDSAAAPVTETAKTGEAAPADAESAAATYAAAGEKPYTGAVPGAEATASGGTSVQQFDPAQVAAASPTPSSPLPGDEVAPTTPAADDGVAPTALHPDSPHQSLEPQARAYPAVLKVTNHSAFFLIEPETGTAVNAAGHADVTVLDADHESRVRDALKVVAANYGVDASKITFEVIETVIVVDEPDVQQDDESVDETAK